MGIKPNFIKNLPLSVFELLMYQNAKTNAKQPLWRKRITLPKTCILSVFDHVTYKKILTMLPTCKESCVWETKGHFEKRVL